MSVDYAPAYRLQLGDGDQRTFAFFPRELRHGIDTPERYGLFRRQLVSELFPTNGGSGVPFGP